jgi:hypothetical protein
MAETDTVGFMPVRMLSDGIELFPEDEQLYICLAVSYMNMGKFRTALPRLLKFQHRKEAIQLILLS